LHAIRPGGPPTETKPPPGRFARATRIASSGVAIDSVGQLAPEEAARRAAEAEEGRVRYEALKLEFQLWTLAAGAMGTATTYFLYTPVRAGF
jgi:ATP synthase protein I